MSKIDRVYGKFTSTKLDNSKLSVSAASEVTYHITESGANTASNIYFDFKRPAEKVTIRVSAACSLVEMNGKTLKSPSTLNAGANPIEIRVDRFKIATTASSVVEVTIK